jgi:hypothetical protein
MFQKHENGKTVHIQGIDCHLPPEGYVYNIITKKLEFRGVYSRSKNKEEQYWERFKMPLWYEDVLKEWDNYDKKKGDDDPDFYNAKLEEYKQQEWDRRLNGFWFMNGGEPCYLTGLYYFYLQWWVIDIGYPKFRIPDLEKFYFIQYTIEDPLCMGILEVTKRRFGKSYVAGLFATEYVTRTKMTNSGIQSKTGADAKKFFAKTVVSPFRRLPKFFRPEYDESLGANPKSEMRFQKTNVRGKNANKGLSKDELGSLIDWQSADTIAYDGQKLHRVVNDEVLKTVEVNVYDRHEVLRYCLLDDEGNIIGKALYTSTVEKIDTDKNGVQEAGKLLWDESDQLNKGADGRTRSGLYRFFMPADRTRNFDKFGYPDVEKTRAAILADRETVKNNPRALSARIRKEPLTIDEAFSIDADDCVFNSLNIQVREKELSENKVYKREVLFYRDMEQNVKIRDARESEKDFCWKFTHFPDSNTANKYKLIDGLRSPINTKEFACTVDSYSNSQGGRKYGSKACAWLGIKYDIKNPDKTGKPIGLLYGRPQVKETLHEQVLLACEYFSCKVWYEFTSDDYLGYFRDRGRVKYLGRFLNSTIEPQNRGKIEKLYGFPITPFSLTRQLDMGIAYVENYCYKIDFIELLPFLKKFDPYDRTKFDMVVSFLMNVVALFEPDNTFNEKKEPLIRVY